MNKKATFHYAVSLKTKLVKEEDFPYQVDQSFSSPDAVYQFLKDIHDSDIEQFIVIYLDAKNKLSCINIQPGTVDQTAVYIRQIVKHGLLSNASSVILAHNHPSGHLEPSEADRTLTRCVKDALLLLQIKVHDHLIVTDNGFLSFSTEGYL